MPRLVSGFRETWGQGSMAPWKREWARPRVTWCERRSPMNRWVWLTHRVKEAVQARRIRIEHSPLSLLWLHTFRDSLFNPQEGVLLCPFYRRGLGLRRTELRCLLPDVQHGEWFGHPPSQWSLSFIHSAGFFDGGSDARRSQSPRGDRLS